jgi:hypothetical protein
VSDIVQLLRLLWSRETERGKEGEAEAANGQGPWLVWFRRKGQRGRLEGASRGLVGWEWRLAGGRSTYGRGRGREAREACRVELRTELEERGARVAALKAVTGGDGFGSILIKVEVC